MPSVKEKLIDLFQRFEATIAKGNEVEHTVWAERAFICIMGEDSPLDEEETAYRYAEPDKLEN